ncbi:MULTISPECIES: hypothetical protein [Flavobacteriaceae]|uniref:hypothetical protein n=1 Tax=Flavobacteriaceae TaxID=49546 RepID=UPI0023491E27|nr:hypothetical protein [Muricauda sp. SP22]MDC6363646.1 hypothetical protein [Muricauda sp. SP22]
MTKRDFFRIVIRLFALYLLLLVIFNFIPSNISYLTFEFSMWPILIIFGSTVLMILLFLFLLRKSDNVIEVLKLDKGFDDDRIEFGNLGSLEIVKIALIFIGGFMILDHLPEFLHYCYLGFKKEISATGLSPFEAPGLSDFLDYFRWFVSGINILIGYLMLSNLGRLTRFLISLKAKQV